MTTVRDAYRKPRTAPRLHEVVRGEREWFCVARDPRCAFTTQDPSAAVRHAVTGQGDGTDLPPLEWPGEV
jgi:hypothetical protein